MSQAQKSVWQADPDGQITKWEPQLPKAPATAAERHAQYRIGLSKVLEVLTRAGFVCNTYDQSSTAISLEKSDFMVDVSIRQPKNIAYVTSHKAYDPKRGNATVIKASEALKCDYLIQVIGSDKTGGSFSPVYVMPEKEELKPAEYVAWNVLKLIASMIPPQKLTEQERHLLTDKALELDA
jgi:hypothetical protein